MPFDWKLYLPVVESLAISALASNLARLHASIDNTDKLNSWEKSLLDNITNAGATAIMAHVAKALPSTDGTAAVAPGAVAPAPAVTEG